MSENLQKRVGIISMQASGTKFTLVLTDDAKITTIDVMEMFVALARDVLKDDQK